MTNILEYKKNCVDGVCMCVWLSQRTQKPGKQSTEEATTEAPAIPVKRETGAKLPKKQVEPTAKILPSSSSSSSSPAPSSSDSPFSDSEESDLGAKKIKADR